LIAVEWGCWALDTRLDTGIEMLDAGY